MRLSSFPARTGASAITVNGSTRLLPVVGNPVSQVKAPFVFNQLLEESGTNALVVPLELPAEQVLESCKTLLNSSSVGGLLVTVPYKKALFKLADRVGTAARQVGAVNALRRDSDGSVVGDLFDGLGFLHGFVAANHDPLGKRVLILGAGGAGSAVAAALAGAGVRALEIFDPDARSAMALVSSLAQHFPGLPVRSQIVPEAQDCDIVINATPLGLKPSDPLPINPQSLNVRTIVADVIMNPPITRLLELAAQQGCPTHPGLPMLAYQVPAYLEFFGLDQAAKLAAAKLKRLTGQATA